MVILFFTWNFTATTASTTSKTHRNFGTESWMLLLCLQLACSTKTSIYGL
ncbi:hypothetical protein C2845_PM16G00100 [Panicum miliaceum]|uniref:Uncharacterized protein n=1 Tax=Panicum miliaceum TaxID=4540 RepID=A0A3L6Q049_PANMI|nr:hypothetical protein C2845_PM16G00100 [Panicum miliaceum]